LSNGHAGQLPKQLFPVAISLPIKLSKVPQACVQKRSPVLPFRIVWLGKCELMEAAFRA